jgi:hypothetical protein
MHDEAKKYLQLADANFRTVPGKNHPFYQKDILPLLLAAEGQMGFRIAS